MRSLALFVWAALAVPALAEMKDEDHAIGDKLVRISVVDTIEIMTVGPSDQEQTQVLSGADVEIVPSTTAAVEG